MYYYLIVWIAASAVITAIAVYRNALLRNEECLRSLGNPDLDRQSYYAALGRRISRIDRWTVAVLYSSIVLVLGHLGYSLAKALVHKPAVWHVLRATIRG